MRIIVHAGMHKTGSSSIQETLFHGRFPGLTYAPWRGPNHSGLFVLLFHKRPERHQAFQKSGSSAASLRKQRDEWQAKLDAALSEGPNTLILSAEAISAGNSANKDAQKRMVAYLRQYTDNVELVAYVRPPAGYMQSAFQQRLKSSDLNSFQFRTLWPNYRQRFGALLELFDEDRISLRPFDRKTLTDGDVVKDFGRSLGTDLSPDQIVRTNESLSLEALSLLYTQRRLGHGLISGFPKAMSANIRFVAALEGFGSEKIRFAREPLLEVFDRNAEDLAWMEEKLGTPISDLPDEDTGQVITSEEDFFAIAETQADALQDHLKTRLPHDVDGAREKLVHDLDLLYLNAIGRCFAPRKRNGDA